MTRHRRDATRDPGSQFIYIRDVRSGAVWSPTYQPTRHEPEHYLVTYQPDLAITQLLGASGLERAVSRSDVHVRDSGSGSNELRISNDAVSILARK